ncbi:Phospholipase A1-Igamma2, chloroplastic [Hondaea fermentalgiana]|uniref:Phospholipase A1-Igamma2, chloroplastic n=1 Tax=Hondaea fermentalgiana TaxID=2315210 RepID=A0A2R5GBJ9_9STRA|nr:Phospholipase A1-Igamma2, chloroplastic [Hondaea fermentalgiana]|eukprot:GBG28357.1 Phospholipase A1-Igamma2, chloroplastic [Hondaea fermentalgiana]
MDADVPGNADVPRNADALRKADAEDAKPLVLLEIIGSRPINCTIIAMFLAMIIGAMYTFVVVGISVPLCGSVARNFEVNQWYKVFDRQDGDLADVAMAEFMMRQTLLIDVSDQDLADGTDGMVPQCAFCNANDLANLSAYFEGIPSEPWTFEILGTFFDDNTTDTLNSTNATDAEMMAVVDIILPLLLLVDVVDDAFGGAMDSSTCLWTFLVDLYKGWTRSSYANIDSVAANGTAANDTAVGYAQMVECLVGDYAGSECYPCGDLTAMGLELLSSDPETGPEFLDISSGSVLDVRGLSRLAPRCAKLLGQTFLAPCRDDSDVSAFMSIFEVDEPSSEERVSRSAAPSPAIFAARMFQSSSQVRLARVTSSEVSDSPSATSTTSVAAAILRDSFLTSSLVNASGHLAYLLRDFQDQLLQGSGEIIDTLSSSCVELPSATSLLVFEEESIFRQEAGQESATVTAERWSEWRACWTALVYYYWKEPTCFAQLGIEPSLSNTSNATGSTVVALDENETETNGADDEDVGSSERILLSILLYSLFNASSRSLPSSSRYGDGFSLTHFAEEWPLLEIGNDTEGIINNTGEAMPFTRDSFVEYGRACNENLMGAFSSGELESALDFLGKTSGCEVPARQVRVSIIADLACWFLGLILLCVQFFWILRRYWTPFSVAMVSLTVAGICICDNGAFIYKTFAWTTEDFKLLIFFNIDSHQTNLEQMKDYIASMRSLALTGFFLFHALTMSQLSRKPFPKHKSGSRLSRWRTIASSRASPAIPVALAFFAFRVCIVNIYLGVHPGFVPLVNMITVIRVCALEETTRNNYCSSSDVDQETAKLAFIGNFVVFFLDAALWTYTMRINSHTRAAIRKLTFIEARDRHLVYNLEMLFMSFLLLALYVCGIMYVSIADVLVGYSGYYAFEDGKLVVKGISLDTTGVDAWDLGFTILLWVFIIGWTLLMVPISSSTGWLFSKAFKTIGKRVQVFASEKDALDALAPNLKTGTKMASEVVFDESVFVTETHLVNFQLTHSTYHIGSVFHSGEGILPRGIHELAYIKDDETDTHVWVLATSDRILIGFRGTTSKRNAQTDLHMGFKSLSWRHTEKRKKRKPRESSAESVKPLHSQVNKEATSSSVADTMDHDSSTGSRPDTSDSVANNRASISGQPSESAAVTRAQRVLGSYAETNRLPKIHGGFLLAFSSIQDQLYEVVSQHLDSHPEVDKVITSGHSLGGALATVCGLYLSTALPSKRALVQVSTFGSPRVGNHAFKRYFHLHVPSCWRFAKRGDPISKTPPRLYGSSRHGYTHVGVEVLLEQSGDAIIDPTVVEHFVLHGCRNGGGADHKVAAYLASLLGFALQGGQRAPSHGLQPLWPNCEERIRAHAKLIAETFPRTSEAILSFIGKATDASETQFKIRDVHKMLEMTESGGFLDHDAASELLDTGLRACVDEPESGDKSAPKLNEISRELNIV